MVYIWSSERHLHLWAAGGADSWEESVWATDPAVIRASETGEGPSGVGVPQEIADDFVVMRMAELYADGTAGSVMTRAAEKYSGNFGCAALIAHADELRTALARPEPSGGLE